MTKEELYEMVYETPLAESLEIEKWLNKFFEQNVVIPKGCNRHPYADVLHEWIEGAEMQRSFNLKSTWVDVTKDSHLFLYGLQELRIKPKETVYEWLFLTKYDSTNYGNWDIFDLTKKYMTNEEANVRIATMDNIVTMIKVEETKRERK